MTPLISPAPEVIYAGLSAAVTELNIALNRATFEGKFVLLRVRDRIIDQMALLDDDLSDMIRNGIAPMYAMHVVCFCAECSEARKQRRRYALDAKYDRALVEFPRVVTGVIQ